MLLPFGTNTQALIYASNPITNCIDIIFSRLHISVAVFAVAEMRDVKRKPEIRLLVLKPKTGSIYLKTIIEFIFFVSL